MRTKRKGMERTLDWTLLYSMELLSLADFSGNVCVFFLMQIGEFTDKLEILVLHAKFSL